MYLININNFQYEENRVYARLNNCWFVSDENVRRIYENPEFAGYIIWNGSSNLLSLISSFLFRFIQVLNQTQDHRQRVLHNVAKELPNWTIMVRKMKAIYHTMNLFNVDVTKKCLIGECWVPVADLTIVRDCLTEGSVGFFKLYYVYKFYDTFQERNNSNRSNTSNTVLYYISH